METGFYAYLWQFNAIVIGLVGIVALIAALGALFQLASRLMTHRPAPRGVTMGQQDGIESWYYWGQVAPREDGKGFTTHLHIKQRASHMMGSSKSHMGQDCVNVLKISQTGAMSWLFETHSQRIISEIEISQPEPDDPEKARHVLNFLEVVEHNADEALARADTFTLYACRPGYDALQKLMEDVSEVREIGQQGAMQYLQIEVEDEIKVFAYNLTDASWAEVFTLPPLPGQEIEAPQ